MHVGGPSFIIICGNELIAILFLRIAATLQCFDLPDARLLLLSCFSPDGLSDFATCSFDNGVTSRCKCGGAFAY